MVVHLHYDINEDTPVPPTLWYPAMCLALVPGLVVLALSWHRFRSLSEGVLAGIVAVGLFVLIPRT
jgi:hypothetical protein